MFRSSLFLSGRGLALLVGLLLSADVARADIEIRRTVVAPGETTILVPAHRGLRRVVLDLVLPPSSRISALASWSPVEQSLALNLSSTRRAVALAQTEGRSPVVFGTIADSVGGAHQFRIEDRFGGGDTIRLVLQVNWTPPRAEPASIEAARPAEISRPADAVRITASTTEPAETLYAAPVKIVELSWREGGTVRFLAAQREGLRLRFTQPVNPELVRDAVRLEVALPGSREGLWRWEEVMLDVRVEGTTVIARLPPKLVLDRETPARLLVDGDRLLSRTGQIVDAEGTGLKLPSGDGRPGGSFRSLLTLIP